MNPSERTCGCIHFCIGAVAWTREISRAEWLTKALTRCATRLGLVCIVRRLPCLVNMKQGFEVTAENSRCDFISYDCVSNSMAIVYWFEITTKLLEAN